MDGMDGNSLEADTSILITPTLYMAVQYVQPSIKKNANQYDSEPGHNGEKYAPDQSDAAQCMERCFGKM